MLFSSVSRSTNANDECAKDRVALAKAERIVHVWCKERETEARKRAEARDRGQRCRGWTSAVVRARVSEHERTGCGVACKRIDDIGLAAFER